MRLISISKWILLGAITIAFSSCSNNDDDDNNPSVDVPSTYVFTHDGESTVSFGGQTARLKMAEELMGALNTDSSTESALDAMFNDGTGFAGEGLDASGKKLGNKTAAYGSATVKGQFDDMITDFATNVVPNWNVDAVAGIAGVHSTANRTVHVNAKGMEMNQCFAKGLIGALCVDQIANGYLSEVKIGDSVDNEDRTEGHTTMEHHWDEGYGYLYGLEEDEALPALGAPGDVLLNKYLKKANESNEPGIGDVIFDAFKHGRAAIVANAHDIKMDQAQIVKENISKIIAYKAVDYLRGAASDLDAEETDIADYFHGLSEGYGFIMSLQFTNFNGAPYFTYTEVMNMIAILEAGNGFWDRTASELDAMAAQIQAAAGL